MVDGQQQVTMASPHGETRCSKAVGAVCAARFSSATGIAGALQRRTRATNADARM
jgi:hypothetical protein